MISAVVLILQAVFNVEIKTEYLSQIIMAMLGLLVMSGIVTDSASDEMKISNNTEADDTNEGLMQLINNVTSTVASALTDIAKKFDAIKEVNITQSVDRQTIDTAEEGTAKEIVPIQAVVESVGEQAVVNMAEEQPTTSINAETTKQPTINNFDPDTML